MTDRLQELQDRVDRIRVIRDRVSALLVSAWDDGTPDPDYIERARLDCERANDALSAAKRTFIREWKLEGSPLDAIHRFDQSQSSK